MKFAAKVWLTADLIIEHDIMDDRERHTSPQKKIVSVCFFHLINELQTGQAKCIRNKYIKLTKCYCPADLYDDNDGSVLRVGKYL